MRLPTSLRVLGRAQLALLLGAFGVLVILGLHSLFSGERVFTGQRLDFYAALLVLISLLVGRTLYRRERLTRVIESLTARPELVLAVGSFALVAGALLVFGGIPLSDDERAHLFQARLFADFTLSGSYPAELLDRMLYPPFQDYFIRVGPDGQAMSVYWPGWALLMTPFVWLGVPWLLGPAMASLSAYLVGRFARLWGGPRAAGIALLLAFGSSAFLLTGMSLHPAGGHLALGLLYAWLLLTPTRRNMLLAGLVGGLALNLHNPVPHAVFALPWLVWLLVSIERRRRLSLLFVGYLPGLFLFGGWMLLQSTFTGPSTGGDSFWLSRLPLLIDLPSIEILWLRLIELLRAWAWSAAGLLLLAVFAWRRVTMPTGLRLLTFSLLSTMLAYTLYPSDQGFGWGARYLHSAWAVLPLLAALLLVTHVRLRRWVLASTLIGLLLVVPFQLYYVHGLSERSMAPLRELAAPEVDLYFIDLARAGSPAWDWTVLNDPRLEGTLVLDSRGAESDQQLVERWFTGARLVSTSSLGSGYARP